MIERLKHNDKPGRSVSQNEISIFHERPLFSSLFLLAYQIPPFSKLKSQNHRL
jgi:hypothetical protein